MSWTPTRTRRNTGSSNERWAFWNGHVFRDRAQPTDGQPAPTRTSVAQSLTAPMPATVMKLLVTPGSVVKKGDTVIVLEAMKMELPIRTPSDATVAAVHCRPLFGMNIDDTGRPETKLGRQRSSDQIHVIC